MIEIDDKIISLDILRERFACDPSACKGACCIEGDAGAPLEIDEIDILEEEYPNYAPYMTAEGREEIERSGFMVVDTDGDYTTPLIDNAQCAYSFVENGITYCAIERSYREGRTSFVKPVSCHLYPIRVMRFSNGSTGLNYHRWKICESACDCGRRLDMPLYKALREPIVRRFGEEFYTALECAADMLDQMK